MQLRPKTDAVLIREYFFAAGTPVPEIMVELTRLTPDEVVELAAEIRSVL